MIAGDGSQLNTVALRPNVMYGELDPYYVTNGLKSASKNKGILQRVGNGRAIFPQAYVGNMAWGHLSALKQLEQYPRVGGHVYFLTDDTPNMDSFTFMEPFLKDKGFSVSKSAIPYFVLFTFLKPAEVFVNLLKPFYRIHLPAQLCSIKYLTMNIHFSREKAEKMLNYSPIHSYKESMEMSKVYYKGLSMGKEEKKETTHDILESKT